MQGVPSTLATTNPGPSLYHRSSYAKGPRQHRLGAIARGSPTIVLLYWARGNSARIAKKLIAAAGRDGK